MKQLTMFPAGDANTPPKYTTAAGSPVYVPRGRFPHLLELRDDSKTKRLAQQIMDSTVTDEEKCFLLHAAQRHIVFHYERIADYYASATPEMQRLMEESALVIIDFNQAIEKGYVQLCDDIRKMHMEELSNA